MRGLPAQFADGSCGWKENVVRMKTLEEALGRYDGKATDVLAEIRATFGSQETLLSELVPLAAHKDAMISDGATWLIKALLGDGGRLTGSETEALLGRLDAITSWQAQLHICQSVGHLAVPTHLARTSADWFEALLKNNRPFLRAWSMDALQELASQDVEMAGRAAAALQAAEQDPAASVRARARARKWKRRSGSR